MQISKEILSEGIEKANKRAFASLVRLKLMFPHGWVIPDHDEKEPIYEKVATLLGKSPSTIRRQIKVLLKLGHIEIRPNGNMFLKNLNPRKWELSVHKRNMIKRKLFKTKLSTVKFTKGMSEKEILAVLTAKLGSDYCRKCRFMYRLKSDHDKIHSGKSPKHFPTINTVGKLMGKYRPPQLFAEKRIVISDKKMAANIGVSLQDFRRNIKPLWKNLGLISWSSSLVQMNLNQNQIRYTPIGKNRFVHNGYAYSHTTQYHSFSEI